MSIQVDRQLAILVDISGSIDAGEFTLQRTGYSGAFRNALLKSGIAAGNLGKIAVIFIYWAETQTTFIDWTLLESESDCDDFADLIDSQTDHTELHAIVGTLTGIGDALAYAIPLFDSNNYTSDSKIIDISGDGVNNNGTDPEDSKADAESAGIKINGITITPFTSVKNEFIDNVITSDGFHLNVADFDAFENGILTKFYVETLCDYVEDGQARKMVDSISGLDHLEGEAIKIQMDGDVPRDSDGVEVSNSFTVSGGEITLPKKAAVVHAGLGYDGIIKFLKSSDGSPVGTGQMKMRRLFLSVLRLYRSLGLKVGIDDDNLDPLFDSDVTSLYNGDQEKLPNTTWSKEVEAVIKQDKPLPAHILAALFRSEVEEKL